MPVRHLTFAFITFFLVTNSFAQTKPDNYSVEELIEYTRGLVDSAFYNTAIDTLKVTSEFQLTRMEEIKVLHRLTDIQVYDLGGTAEVWQYLDRLESLLNKEQSEIRGQVAYKRGFVLKRQGEFDESIPFLEQTFVLSKDKWILKNAIGQLIFSYNQVGNYEKALDFGQRGIAMATHEADSNMLSRMYEHISIIHKKNEHYTQALQYIDLALQMYEANGFGFGASIYTTKGLLHKAMADFDQSEEYLQKAKSMAGMSITGTLNLADLYNETQSHEEALAQINELNLAELPSYYLLYALLEKSKALKGLGQMEAAIGPALMAEGLTVKHSGIELQKDANQLLYEISEELGHYEEALEYYRTARLLTDSLHNIDKQNTIAELEARYQTAQKEEEIRRLEGENNLNLLKRRNMAIMGASGFVIFAVIMAFLFFRRRKQQELSKVRIQELQELDQLKSQFFANASHELRTPLTLIQGPVKNLMSQTECIHPKESPELGLIYRNSQKLLALVEEILDLSKVDAGKLSAKPSDVRLLDVVSPSFLAHQLGAQTKEVEMEMIYLAPDDMQLSLDANKFEKILDNLLGNAVKFTPKGGNIRLIIEELERESMIRIVVKDSGIGIDSEDLPFVFDRYFQSKNEGDAHVGGTGIGLALAREFAHLMAGDISVTSRKGEGSTFTFDFKIAAASGEVQECDLSDGFSIALDQKGETTHNPPVKTGFHVLLVEDHPDMQTYVQSILEPYLKVSTVGNGREALEFLKYHHQEVDLIVSDLMMPEMDGMTLLETLRHDDLLLHIPVIMLTARADQSDKLHALVAGVDDYVTKPFDVSELKARVRNLLRRTLERSQFTSEKSQQANESVITKQDMHWIKKVEEILNRELGNSQFNMTTLADELATSERNLRYKIKKITGLSPIHYFREIKLKFAHDLIETGNFQTAAQLASKIGFENVQYFTRLFEKRFGKKLYELLQSA